MTDPLPIIPFTKPANGSVILPGSKSITNRALILAALCKKSENPIVIENALFSRDTKIMITALKSLGFSIEDYPEDKSIKVNSLDGDIPINKAKLNVGNAGTAARFLTAFLSLKTGGEYFLDGDEAMHKRPIKPLLDALESIGAAEIIYHGENGYFPFTMKTKGIQGGSVDIDISLSSQFLSALLLISHKTKNDLNINITRKIISKPFIDMTVLMLKLFGIENSVNCHSDNKKFQITPHPAHQPNNRIFPVDSDATAASYFAALPIITNGEIQLDGISLTPEFCRMQGDSQFINLLATKQLIEIEHKYKNIVIKKGSIKNGFREDFNAFSDTFLTIAAIALLLECETIISGIEHTRNQETDRMKAVATELGKLVGEKNISEEKSSIQIRPDVNELKHRAEKARENNTLLSIDTYEDHRIAMSFAILGSYDLLEDGKPWLQINDPTCCRKTFPNFFDELEKLRVDSNFISHGLNTD